MHTRSCALEYSGNKRNSLLQRNTFVHASPSVLCVQQHLLGRSISEWESAAQLFEATETQWLSAVSLTLAHATVDGGAYLTVIMGIMRSGLKTVFSESSN